MAQSFSEILPDGFSSEIVRRLSELDSLKSLTPWSGCRCFRMGRKPNGSSSWNVRVWLARSNTTWSTKTSFATTVTIERYLFRVYFEFAFTLVVHLVRTELCIKRALIWIKLHTYLFLEPLGILPEPVSLITATAVNHRNGTKKTTAMARYPVT